MDDIIRLVHDEDPIGFRDQIHQALALKVNDAIEMKKIQIAQSYTDSEVKVEVEAPENSDDSALEWGTDASVDAYKEMTPGETPNEE